MSGWDDDIARLEGQSGRSGWDEDIGRLEAMDRPRPPPAHVQDPALQPVQRRLPGVAGGVDLIAQWIGQNPRAAGRMATQAVGTAGGIAGGTALGGPVGGLAGGAAGNVASGQAFDAVADRLMGTEQRPPLASVDTVVDAAAGAIGPAAAMAARPLARIVTGVSARMAERVDAAVRRAVGNARGTITEAEKATINREAQAAADDAFNAAMEGGMTPAQAEAAAVQAGREAASAAARQTWQQAEAAGRVPPKTAGGRRSNPAVTEEARQAAERARDEARQRVMADARIADPEAATAAGERARQGFLDARQAEIVERGRVATAEASARAAARAGSTVARGTELGAIGTVVGAGDPVFAGTIFAAGRGISAVQRAIAQRMLQNEGFRAWVQERGVAFGTRRQTLASLAAAAGDTGLDETMRADAQALRADMVGSSRNVAASMHRRGGKGPDRGQFTAFDRRRFDTLQSRDAREPDEDDTDSERQD